MKFWYADVFESGTIVIVTRYDAAPTAMYGGAPLSEYVAVVLIHTFASGVGSVGLTCTVYDATLELYARLLVVRKPSVVAYPGPFASSHDWKSAISPTSRVPSPLPSVASI